MNEALPEAAATDVPSLPDAPVRRRGGRSSSLIRSRGDGLRTCLGCGQLTVPGRMMRLSTAGEWELTVQVSREKRGRGAYICFRRACVETVFRKRRLSRALRASGISAGPAVVLEQAGRQLQAHIDRLLSTAHQVGRLATGASDISRALKEDRIRFLVVAADVSTRRLEQFQARSRTVGIPLYSLALTRAELGRLLGEDALAGGAVRSGALAEDLEEELQRLTALAS